MPLAEDEDRGKVALTELFDEVKTDDTPEIVEKILDDLDGIVRLVRFTGWQKVLAGERKVN